MSFEGLRRDGHEPVESVTGPTSPDSGWTQPPPPRTVRATASVPVPRATSPDEGGSPENSPGAPGGYAAPAGYAEPGEYGDPAGYAEPDGGFWPDTHAESGRYAESDAYAEPGGHPMPGYPEYSDQTGVNPASAGGAQAAGLGGAQATASGRARPVARASVPTQPGRATGSASAPGVPPVQQSSPPLTPPTPRVYGRPAAPQTAPSEEPAGRNEPTYHPETTRIPADQAKASDYHGMAAARIPMLGSAAPPLPARRPGASVTADGSPPPSGHSPMGSGRDAPAEGRATVPSGMPGTGLYPSAASRYSSVASGYSGGAPGPGGLLPAATRPGQGGAPSGFSPAPGELGNRPLDQAARASSADPRPRRWRRALLAVAGVVLLALLGVGAYLAFNKVGNDSDPFTINSCVKESDRKTGVAARCTDAGAFVIVAKVDRAQDCPDPNQPFLELTVDSRTQVLCLAPAGSGDGVPAVEPSVTPS